MSLLQYTITNQSAVAKTFTYYSASAYHKISVGGFGTVVFEADDAFPPAQDVTGVPENIFVSDTYIPPSGSAWLWNNGEKVQYIKISDTPATGSNISSIINRAEWIEFSMIEAVDKNGTYLYPTSPNSSRVERYIIDNALDRGLFNSIVINSSSPETSIAVSANTSSAETGFSYIDQQFSIDQDCDPLLNNATEPRINEWLQDVDYSVNAITPVNFNQLINFTATKASVPQSNYTQLGFLNSRYVGSSTTRDNINEYNPLGISDPINKVVFDEQSPELIDKGKGPSLGKIPNVELNNAYIAYFNRIIDPYPLLNNKVAYYTKYLIDESGNILDPSVSDINFSIYKDTFQLKDYDNQPTRVNTAISSIEQGKELVKLTEGLNPVYRVGSYPVPILYTQTSSIGNVDQITLSGSEFFTALGGPGKTFLKLGMGIYSTQSDAVIASSPTSVADLSSLGALDWLPVNITPFTSNAVPNLPTSSNAPTQSILFPINDNNPPYSTPGAGNPLSDKYVIKGSFTFTTSTIPAKYTGTDKQALDNTIKFYKARERVNAKNLMTVTLSPYVKPYNDPDNVSSYKNTTTGFKIKPDGIKLVITVDPGGSNPTVYPPLVIEEKPPISSTPQWSLTGTSLNLTPNSLYIEELIIRNLLRRDPYNAKDREDALLLIAGGWATVGGVNYGWGGIPVKYDWTIEFEFDDVVQGTGFFLTCTSTMATQNDDGAGTRPEDIFLFIGPNGRRPKPDTLFWKRTFNPQFANLPPSRPILQYSVTSPLSDNAVTNKADGPFWRRYPLTSDELYMESTILNQTYGKSFVQAKLPYNGAVNTDFPLTVEPSFIEFDPVTDFWELQPGDEIRFENKEEYTYRITSIEGRDPITKPVNSDVNIIANKLRVVVSPPFEYTGSNGEIKVNQPSNFDFFVVRRFKENKNFIILDQQMPYGIISTGKGEIAFSETDSFVGVEPVNPSSSPGLLLTEHRVDKFNVNPDLVLKDLIEKRII
jgi:hypothetical protein